MLRGLWKTYNGYYSKWRSLGLILSSFKCRFVGFGTFNVSSRAATTGRNARTGEAIKIPASKQAKFKAGKELKDAVNK